MHVAHYRLGQDPLRIDTHGARVLQSAVLDCCWGADQNRCFSGGVDRTVTTYDFIARREQIIGEDLEFLKAFVGRERLFHVFRSSLDGRPVRSRPHALTLLSLCR
jgi:hypothetical protein